MHRPVERFTVNIAVGRPRPAAVAGPAAATAWWPVLLLAAAGVLVGLLAPAA